MTTSPHFKPATAPPPVSEQCRRLGWREVGGFELRRDHDGAPVLVGHVMNFRAKVVPARDGSGGCVLLVEREPVTRSEPLSPMRRGMEAVEVMA